MVVSRHWSPVHEIIPYNGGAAHHFRSSFAPLLSKGPNLLYLTATTSHTSSSTCIHPIQHRQETMKLCHVAYPLLLFNSQDAINMSIP